MMAIHMRAIPAKRRELLQTLERLMKMFYKEPGFLRAQLWLNMKDQNDVTLCIEWDTQENADRYIRQSDYYRVLLGAQQLLAASSEIVFRAASLPDGMDLIYVVPGDSEDRCTMTAKAKRFWDCLNTCCISKNNTQ